MKSDPHCTRIATLLYKSPLKKSLSDHPLETPSVSQELPLNKPFLLLVPLSLGIYSSVSGDANSAHLTSKGRGAGSSVSTLKEAVDGAGLLATILAMAFHVILFPSSTPLYGPSFLLKDL